MPPSGPNGSARGRRTSSRADFDVVQVAARLGEEAAPLDVLQVLAERLAGHGQAVEMQQVAQLEHDRRHAAGVPEVFDRVAAGGLGVGQHRHAAMDAVEVVDA